MRTLSAAICLVALAGSVQAGTVLSHPIHEIVYADPANNWVAFLGVGVFTTPMVWIFNGSQPDDMLSHNGIDIVANVGQTFWASSDQDDPDYSRLVARLTDDAAYDMWVETYGYGGGFGSYIPLCDMVAQAEHRDVYDLKGYTINGIGLTIDSATYYFDPAQSRPHVYDMHMTFAIEYSPVPEPASAAALMTGIAALAGTARLRRRFLTF